MRTLRTIFCDCDIRDLVFCYADSTSATMAISVQVIGRTLLTVAHSRRLSR